MIRFSAALVAVAIGVLIGGIATSKLLLVYIAIVVSAVALLALAIGVMVKREELFGEAQGLVPAGAGAAPVQPARTGGSQDQPTPVASVPPPAPFQGPAAGYGSAFDGTALGGTVQAAPSSPAANPSAPHQAPDGPGRDRVADPVPPWEAQSARDQWSSSPRPASTTVGPAPDWMPSGRAASAPAGQAPPTAPSPAMPTERSVPSGRPSAGSAPAGPAPATAPSLAMPPERSVPSGSSSVAPSSAGPEPASPNWFAPKARPADAAPAAADTGSEPGPGEPESREADSVPADPEPGSAEPEPESAELDAELDTVPAESPAGSAESEPPSADGADPVPGDDLVTVLRGVPRYHQPDCVLIRFMSEGDVQRLPAAQAEADGCTPCAACQPVE